jgi:hypothetical protein
MGLGEPDEIALSCQQVYWDLVGNPNWWRPRLGVLEKTGRDFTVVDEDSIAQGKVQRGTLIVGSYRLQVVILPGVAALKAKTFDRLFSLAKSGGTVIAVGRVPSLILGKTAEETTTAVKSLFGVEPTVELPDRSEVKFSSGGSGIFVKDAAEVTKIP